MANSVTFLKLQQQQHSLGAIPEIACSSSSSSSSSSAQAFGTEGLCFSGVFQFGGSSSTENLECKVEECVRRSDFCERVEDDCGGRNGEGFEDFEVRENSGQRLEHGAHLERRRRRNMKQLCSVLTSLLPLQRLQEKRCLSDRLQDVADYIVNLEGQIKSLETKQDPVFRRTTHHRDSVKDGSSVALAEMFEFPRVSVRKISSTFIQVLVDGTQPGVPMSGILEIIEASGATVLNASLFPVQEMNFFSVLSEVPDVNDFDISSLHSKIQELTDRGSLE